MHEQTRRQKAQTLYCQPPGTLSSDMQINLNKMQIKFWLLSGCLCGCVSGIVDTKRWSRWAENSWQVWWCHEPSHGGAEHSDSCVWQVKTTWRFYTQIPNPQKKIEKLSIQGQLFFILSHQGWGPHLQSSHTTAARRGWQLYSWDHSSP